MLVVQQWYLVPQTATRLLQPSSLLHLLQSLAGPADAGLCLDTQSAVASHPVTDRETDQAFNRKNVGVMQIWLFWQKPQPAEATHKSELLSHKLQSNMLLKNTITSYLLNLFTRVEGERVLGQADLQVGVSELSLTWCIKLNLAFIITGSRVEHNTVVPGWHHDHADGGKQNPDRKWEEDFRY